MPYTQVNRTSSQSTQSVPQIQNYDSYTVKLPKLETYFKNYALHTLNP